MEKIIGLIDAPFTPFYENGEVNYEPIEAYAKMLHSRCVHQRVFRRGLYAHRRRAHEAGGTLGVGGSQGL